MKLKIHFTAAFCIFSCIACFSQTADDYFANACQLTIEGNYSKALKYYTKTIETDASFGFAYLNRASTYILVGKQEKALADVQYYLKNVDSTSIQAMEMRGILLVEEDKYSEAIPDLETVFAKNPESTYLNYYLGISYYEINKYKIAIDYLYLYFEENPDDWESCYYLAKSYYEDKNSNHFIEFSRKCLELIVSQDSNSEMRKAKKDLKRLQAKTAISF